MNFESQVSTFKQSAILHGLGVRHNPVCWWKAKSKQFWDKTSRWISFEKEGYYRLSFPAFTIKDLGEIIPETIQTEEGENDLIWYKKDNVFWCEYFEDGNVLKKHHAKNEAILRASVLITLIKDGYFVPSVPESQK